jgi:hypothetical protein
MSARPALLRQFELTRCAKAMRAADVREWRVEMKPDGTIIIIAGKPGPDDGGNDWDAK